MLIGELPELVDTRAGQDILKIGEERGLVEAAVILLQTLGARQLRQLLADAIPWESLDPLDAP